MNSYYQIIVKGEPKDLRFACQGRALTLVGEVGKHDKFNQSHALVELADPTAVALVDWFFEQDHHSAEKPTAPYPIGTLLCYSEVTIPLVRPEPSPVQSSQDGTRWLLVTEMPDQELRYRLFATKELGWAAASYELETTQNMIGADQAEVTETELPSGERRLNMDDCTWTLRPIDLED